MSGSKTITWREQDAAAELHPALAALGEHYPIRCGEGGKRGATAVRFVQQRGGEGVRIEIKGGVAEVTYDRPFHAMRGVGALLAGLVKPGLVYEEHVPFTTFGIMLDCSRNAVMKVDHLKKWLRQLSLLGYNMVMLYTEDTYELPDEPYFGYLRGRYTAEELREIDGYAASLGMEMIGCIQTLGHLQQILRWHAYAERTRDTASVLLVDEEKTYALIDKMIAQFAQAYRSRRIHVGMDETHDLGRGKFMDRFGHQRGFDIFNRHLAKVVDICGKHGLKPMIWSDMYFRMGSQTGDYYDANAKIPADVAAAIPAEAELVYWDYYHEDEGFYRDHIDRHRALGKEPLMGSGVWTWLLPWHDFDHTRRTAGPCVTACRERKVRELFFTMWGDNGGYCEFDSALSGLTYTAELAYAGRVTDESRLAKRFAAICGADYRKVVAASGLMFEQCESLLWDDPLLGINWKTRSADRWKRASKHYHKLASRLSDVAGQTEPVDFAHAVNMAEYLAAKIDLSLLLDKAYAKRDKKKLAEVRKEIPAMIRLIDRLHDSFRRQWYRRNKTFGFEMIQVRMGGIRQRYQELKDRLKELAAGRIDRIEELEQRAGEEMKRNWRDIVSGSIEG